MNAPLLPKPPCLRFVPRPYVGRDSHDIVRDLCTVLQQQMDALAEEGFDDFSETELNAYRLRQERIGELRKELGDFRSWASRNDSSRV
jgi:hypothetical protein